MFEKITALALLIIAILAGANYLISGTGFPPEAIQLIRDLMDSVSDSVAVMAIMIPIFLLLAPIALFISRAGGK